jgi:HlyD family secretion protein
MLKNKYFIIGAIIVLMLIVFGFTKAIFSDADVDLTGSATFTVKPGPLTISVLESGTIKALEQIIIKNEVEGRTSIIYLIDEGVDVEIGQLLVELDASSLEDEKIDQEIRVQNAEASFINAKESLAVTENQARSDKELAELNLEFAKQDIKKYIDGDYPNELRKAAAEITVAEEELTRAEDTNEWSSKLYNEKYISDTEYKADKLSVIKKALDLELAENNKELLINFTYQRNLAQFKSDVSQAGMALERTNRKARADVIQAEAELKAKEAEFARQKDKLTKIIEQIGKTKITAPAAGRVIYATSAKMGGFRSNVEPLDEGQEIRERQELIYLPVGKSSKAEISVHETNMEKIALDLPALITVDAIAGKKFYGKVKTIAPLPDAQSMFMNPDLKVYTTEIFIESNDESLRTGMSCRAEIVVEQYKNALFVPIQSVMRIDNKPTVYVMSDAEFVPVEIKTGLDNNVMVHVLSGVKAGDVVLMTPPLKAGAADKNLDLLQRPDFETGKTKQKSQRPAGQTGSKKPISGNTGEMSQEKMQEMKKKFESMSPEEKEKMKQRFKPKKGR